MSRAKIMAVVDALPVVAPPPRWERLPGCVTADPETFFPLDEDGPGALPARRICAGCSVRDQCLEYAVRMGMPAGVWGGLSTTQRGAVLRAQRSGDGGAR